MTVTVCIPAYRAGLFITETLGSVLHQTHGDLKVRIAIDPPADGSADDTRPAIEAFTDDPRVEIVSNPQRLGWAKNVQSLLERVDTAFYAILPHDDVWAPRYVATMLGELAKDPEASVAYSDLMRFGNIRPLRRAVVLPDTDDRAAHYLHYLMSGARSMPWRGVTRSSTLGVTGGFPHDDFRGYAVESEYTMELFNAGRTLWVPRVLYFKRYFPQHVKSGARQKFDNIEREEKMAAWRVHAARMEAIQEKILATLAVPAESRRLYEVALLEALMRRWDTTIQRIFPHDILARGLDALSIGDTGTAPEAKLLSAHLNVLLYKHYYALGQFDEAEARLREAEAAAPQDGVVHNMRGKAHLRAGRLYEALEHLAEDVTLSSAHNSDAQRKIADIYDQLNWHSADHVSPPEPVPAGPPRRSWFAKVWR